MGLKEAVVSVFSKYATFSGRATRSEYWFFYLFNIIMSFGLIAVCSIIGAIFKGLDGATGGYMVGAILYWIYAIAAFIPGLAVSVRRLHDTDVQDSTSFGCSCLSLELFFFWYTLPLAAIQAIMLTDQSQKNNKAVL